MGIALRELGIVARVSKRSEGNFAVVTSGLIPTRDNYLRVAAIVRHEDADAFVKVTFTPGDIQESEPLQTCFAF